jgi:hypothetical protein
MPKKLNRISRAASVLIMLTKGYRVLRSHAFSEFAHYSEELTPRMQPGALQEMR